MSSRVIMGALLIGLLAAVTLFPSCRDYIETTISNETVKLSSDWQELPINSPLRCDRKDQEILLTSAVNYQPSLNPPGMQLQDGSVARPEAEIVAEDGQIYKLSELSFWGPDVVLRNSALPRSTRYDKLRLRSNIPVQLAKVRFNCYNYEDVKR